MIIQLIILFLGLALLIKGADWLVNGASGLAKKYNVSDLAIGLTVVAFGTSAPELVVNSFAAYQGHQDIVFGNIIGSNIFNIFVILGVTGVIAPLVVHSSTVWKEIPFSLIAIILFYLMANDLFYAETHIMSRFDGIILVIIFVFFLFYEYKNLKTDPVELDVHYKPLSNLKIWGLIAVGLAGLVVGGKLVLDNAVQIATTMGVSEKIIGLTIVAAGTSLPELATSVVAVLKKNSDIAVGNIVGSNIFNIFLILGASSLIRPLEFNPAFNFDLSFLAVGTLVIFIAMFTGKKKKLDRWEAAILLLLYIGYTFYLISKEIN